MVFGAACRTGLVCLGFVADGEFRFPFRSMGGFGGG